MSRYPCALQYDSTDCAIACLVSVAHYHGRRPFWSKLREIAKTGRDGTSLLGLAEAARAAGFDARMVESETRDLSGVPMPLIAHLRNGDRNHYVVVYGVRRGQVRVADPAVGVHQEPMAVFLARWTGTMLLLSPDRDLPEELEAPNLGLRFAKVIMPHRRLLAAAVLGAAAMSGLSYGSSYLFGYLVDHVYPTGRAAALGLVGTVLLSLAIVTALMTLANGLVQIALGQRVTKELLLSVLRRLLRLPLAYFESRQSGDIVHRVNNLLYVAESVAQIPVTLVLYGSMVILSGTLLYLKNWQVALAVTCLFPVLLPLTILIRKRLQVLYMESLGAQGAVQAAAMSALGAIATIKACGSEGQVTEGIQSKMLDVLRLERRTGRLTLIPNAIDGLVFSTAIVMIYWRGGSMLMHHQISLGQLVTCVALVGSMFPAFQALVGTSLQVQRVLAYLERATDILDVEPERGHGEGLVPAGGFRGEIDLEGVSFRYGHGNAVVSDVTFRVHPGEWVAIVGESGSGKSTLLKLIQRFYDPEEGRILVDGIDLREARLSEWRAMTSAVDQECQVFPGSIRENLRLGGPDPDPESLARASWIAGLNELIQTLPDLYETRIGDHGVGISGGERQRMAMARAVMRRPRVLLLDEATAHLDPMMEREIFARLGREMKGTTIIMATHRTALAKLADRVIVMAGGRVIQDGAPGELIARGGAFERICELAGQSGPLEPESLNASTPAAERERWSEDSRPPGIHRDPTGHRLLRQRRRRRARQVPG